MSRVLPQLIVFSYHKSGTTLFLRVMTKVGERLGLSVVNHYGQVNQLEVEPDVVLLPHSQNRALLDRPYRAIRLIRDPRDIWVSGYMYHQRCEEEWCLNTDMNPTPPIQWPKIDHSVEHWSEAWKQRYLKRLGGRSYQQNLLDHSLVDGLDFELAGYTGCTLATMREWDLNGADALDVKLEDVMADFDGAMRRIFGHFCFTADQTEAALTAARSEDVRRMDDAAIAERPQINSRIISKWRNVLSAVQIARFEERHGDLIRTLGYPSAVPEVVVASRLWVGPQQRRGPLSAEDKVPPAGVRPPGQVRGLDEATQAATTPDAGVSLRADGTSIRPTAVGKGMYTFVVPAGRGLIRLESRRGLLSDRAPDDLGCMDDASRVGVKVIQVVVRSDAGDIVIAADDPRLIKGWHHVEHIEGELGRWTDGSADLPWTGISGPALVTVRCITLARYPAGDDVSAAIEHRAKPWVVSHGGPHQDASANNAGVRQPNLVGKSCERASAEGHWQPPTRVNEPRDLPRTAVVTMVYNERINLPIWIRHYTSHCPGATLFVIDHGSDDGSTNDLLGVTVIPFPHTPFDDQTRIEIVSDFQHALLRLYDVVIYTDCDEMVVADPRIHASLSGFLAAVGSDVISPVGLNLHHLLGSEAPIDLRSPILGQRRYVRFASSMCKPSIARVPLLWVPGFHWCDHLPDYRSDLFQFHLRWMDLDTSLARLRITRSMAWSERALRHDWAPRQRQSDQQRIVEEFEEPAERVRAEGALAFTFEAEMQRLLQSLHTRDGHYQGDAFRGAVAQVPEAFFGLI
jgi:hypothetical protein